MTAAAVLLAAATNHLDNVPWSIAVADVNGDGKVDLISGVKDVGGAVTVLTNDGSGGFVTSTTIPVGATGGWELMLTAADVNGDGKPDVIAADLYSDTLTVLTNDGSGGFAQDAVLNVGGVSGFPVPDSVAVADMNRDGKMDLVCAKQAAVYRVQWRRPRWICGHRVAATGSQPGSVMVADQNGDGKLSVICANSGDNTL